MQLTDLSQWIESEQPDIEETLKTLVEINTYTANTDGVDTGIDTLSRMAQEMGFKVEAVNARHRLIRTGDRDSPKPRVLLITHMDTVHPPDGDFQHYQPLNDGFVTGPGVGDIKGGTVMGLWTMKAINQMLDDHDVQMIVSVDEEVGSPSIKSWYGDADAHGADYAIGLEPGFPQGDLTATVPLGVVHQRRGYAAIEFTVQGKNAHSGTPHLGLSAVEAVAHKILKLQALNAPERGISVNVGVVNGGTAPNTVPGQVNATVSFRYETLADGQATRAAIEEIIEQSHVSNPEIDLKDTSTYELVTFIPPMESTAANQALVDIVLQEAEKLGHDVVPIARGGGSDANHVSGSGVPSICGMGAPSQHIHTPHEKIHLPMLFERIELLTRTVYRITTEAPAPMDNL